MIAKTRILPFDFIVENKKRLNVDCPECKKGNLIMRQNTENRTYFLGCTEYPNCRYTEFFVIESKDQMKFDFIGEEKFNVARLDTMRIWNLKSKLREMRDVVFCRV